MELTQEMKERNAKNLFFKRYLEKGIRESLFSDMTGALGHMRTQIVQTAYPEFIGRKIIVTMPTKEPVEMFPVDEKAVAYKYAEGCVTRLSGKKTQAIAVTANIIAEASEQWTREFIEDAASWNVMQNTNDKMGKALAEEETRTVLDLYGSIEDEDLACGGPIDQGNRAMDWSAVSKLHNAVREEHWRPRKLVLNTTQLSQLLEDNRFIEFDSLPSSEVDVDIGTIRRILGMEVIASTLVPIGTAYAIDPFIAGVMLIRRDVTIEDWSEPKTGLFGVKATTRFGLGILRSSAVAKMVNIKTSL